MTLKEEIIRASGKTTSPEFTPVTCEKPKRGNEAGMNVYHTEVTDTIGAIKDISKELTVSLITTQELLPFAVYFMMIPPNALLFFVSSLFVSAFEAGRAFEQNRQDAAIADLLERENRE